MYSTDFPLWTVPVPSFQTRLQGVMMNAKCPWPILLFPFSFVFHFVQYYKLSNLFNQNGFREELLSTTDKNGEKKEPLYI